MSGRVWAGSSQERSPAEYWPAARWPRAHALPHTASRERCGGRMPSHNGRKMSVDVIVPAFNRVEWLAECLSSVITQSYPNFRLIGVDEGSTPPLSDWPTLAAIFHDGRVRLIRSANKGPASARNLGLAMADSEFVLTLDS